VFIYPIGFYWLDLFYNIEWLDNQTKLMVDNTKVEHSDNSTNKQSESFSNESTPCTDQETSSKNKEPQNMEVHHHTHDPFAPHHKKNFLSYFWEFLMLFLAVFCDFLAEYTRPTLQLQIAKQLMDLE